MDEHSSSNPLIPTPQGHWTPASAETRHDGWSGEKMATFCEVLAETGIVTDACLTAGMNRSGAYVLRQRDPLFAAAWDAALGFARAKLADTLLERSLEGSVERIYRGGEVVAEKHYVDNRLALAVLKRLDKQADRAVEEQALPAVLGGEWETALAALRSGGSAELAALLSEGDKTDKLDTPPESFFSEGENDAEPPEHPEPRVWTNGCGDWHTDFPPPGDFDGYEFGSWGDTDYERECSAAELAALRRSGQILDQSERRAAAEAERDQWFAALEAEPEEEQQAEEEAQAADQPGSEPPSAATPQAAEGMSDDRSNRDSADGGPVAAGEGCPAISPASTQSAATTPVSSSPVSGTPEQSSTPKPSS